MTDDRMRITESLRLEGASGNRLVPPHCSRQAQLQQVTQGCSHLGFEYLQGWRLRNLSGQTVLLPDHPHHKNQLFLCTHRISRTSLHACCLLPGHWADRSQPPHQVFIHTDGLCWTHSSMSMSVLYWGAQTWAQHC